MNNQQLLNTMMEQRKEMRKSIEQATEQLLNDENDENDDEDANDDLFEDADPEYCFNVFSLLKDSIESRWKCVEQRL